MPLVHFLRDDNELALDTALNLYRFVAFDAVCCSRRGDAWRECQVQGCVRQQESGVRVEAKVERQALDKLSRLLFVPEFTVLTLAAEKAMPEKAYRSATTVIPRCRSFSIAAL